MCDISTLSNMIAPYVPEGDNPADYVIELSKKGGLGTRHLKSGRYLPYVVAQDSSEMVPNEFLALSPQVQSGLLLANLGVGLLNLGVSTWTAFKVRSMDAKLDVLSTSVTQIDRKIDSISGVLESSVVYLKDLIKENALMLGVLLEHQQNLGEGIALLRHELARGVYSIHETIKNVEAQHEARRLEEQMRTLFRYYEACSHTLNEGRRPSAADLRRIVDIANEFIAWLDTRLAEMAVGKVERQPLFIARAFALRLEMEARELLDETTSARSMEYDKLLSDIQREIHAIADHTPLMQLAIERSAVIEAYIYLHRSLRGNATFLEFHDGKILPLFPKEYFSWDDELDEFRQLAAVPATQPVPQRIELKTIEEHNAWRQMMGLPRGATADKVETKELVTALGLPASVQCSEDALRKMLRQGPEALDRLHSKIKYEVDGWARTFMTA